MDNKISIYDYAGLYLLAVAVMGLVIVDLFKLLGGI